MKSRSDEPRKSNEAPTIKEPLKKTVPRLSLKRNASETEGSDHNSTSGSSTPSSTPGTPTSGIPKQGSKNSFFKRRSRQIDSIKTQLNVFIDEIEAYNYLMEAEKKSRKIWSKSQEKHPFHMNTKDGKYELTVFPAGVFGPDMKVLLLNKHDKVGSGSKSTLYKACDLHTGEILTAKIYKYNPAEKMDGFHEIAPLKALKRYRGHVQLPDKDLIVFRIHAEGRDLSEIMKDIKPFQKLRILCGLMKEILLLHKAGEGFLHGDIKPGNIVVNKKDEVVLIDYDCALPVHKPKDAEVVPDRKNPYKQTRGTVGYHAHHLQAADPVNRREYCIAADYHVLGIIIAELITSSGSYAEKIKKIEDSKSYLLPEEIQNLLRDILKPSKKPTKTVIQHDAENSIEEDIYYEMIFPELKEAAQELFLHEKDDDYVQVLLERLEIILENCVKLNQALEQKKEADAKILALKGFFGSKLDSVVSHVDRHLIQDAKTTGGSLFPK